MAKAKSKKNPQIEFITQENISIPVNHKDNEDPLKTALWFDQALKLDDVNRLKIIRVAMTRIRKAKPETYEFIKSFNCKLVGIIPRVEYSLTGKEGKRDLEYTWIHSFSQPTLLFWCEKGGFGFFVNSVLDYDNSILNNIKGNTKADLKGFTG